MTGSHFIAGPAPGAEHTDPLWHVAADLRLLPRCGTDVIVTARIPVIDMAAFSATHRVCFTCAPGADLPASVGDSAMIQAELALEVGAE